jgi:hypothetical protein
MSAKIVVVPEADWPAVGRFLESIKDGAIVMAPDVAAAFEAKYGRPVPAGATLPDYDYGDDPDYALDRIYPALDPSWSLPLEALLEHMDIVPDLAHGN